MKKFNPVFGALALSFCAAAFSVQAQTAGGGAVMSKDQISAKYDADMKRCDSMKGNDKDVCQKQAKADRVSQKADAKQAKDSAESRHDANKDKMDAQYKVAKEKCDAMSGDAKDQCMANAKTRYNK
ncbi:hypothetical protein [Pollutimonas bauzanensis]|uniref:PsiF repeat-containing protein n=1 Tax=Pollutimonas bauzanensis TaxID=658167 RepID=A0A1M5W7B7_9BURK|nr:hypothetical protein [Pollutimonas bauzanensis]SHH83479.1 hypothetical protein SAMN04488135_105125 [Pollutimonas bauzanensis]